ncbi:MAG: MarR family winged helix-turn-helix transcriptional regulator [Pikeienuella sp.]
MSINGVALAPDYDDELGGEAGGNRLARYLETLSLVERLHRLLLDVIKDEFERIARFELNPVQALLLFNIGPKTMTAGELKNRGCYQGSNVSYNLKRLVETGFIHHARSEVDRRAVRVCLTEKGMEVHHIVADLFRRHAEDLAHDRGLRAGGLDALNGDLRGLERYWSEEIRYIY